MNSSHSSGPKKSARRLCDYRICKLKKLIDRCHKKRIVFPEKFVIISTRFAKDVNSVSDEDIVGLMSECNQSLGSDDENRSDSSSDSEQNSPTPKKARIGQLLTPSPKQLDPLNPYNQAWSSQRQFQQATMGLMALTRPLFPVATPQQHHFSPIQQYLTQPRLLMDPNIHYHYNRMAVPQQGMPLNYSQTSVQTNQRTLPESSDQCTVGEKQIVKCSTPTSFDGFSSPQMSSTPVPVDENDDNNNDTKRNEEPMDYETVSQSVDGTNNGNDSGN